MATPVGEALTGRRALRPGTRPVGVLPLASLLVLPVLVFLVPVAFGHLFLPGDDLTQNYPLRVLVGWQLRHGHLPLWDPYIWSGTPLLGGFNAGAFYPATLLFAVLPASVAWGLGQAVTAAVTAAGLYLFLRRRVATLPAWLGAFVFTWGGFLMAQWAHLGLVEGQGWVGWMLLAVDHITGPLPGGSPGPDEGRRISRPLVGTAGLGLAGGLVALAGDPRALSNVAVPVLLYAAWRLVRLPGGRARPVALLAAAGVLAGLVGSPQLLPGLAAQAASQRAAVTYDTFTAGSLAPPWLSLLTSPFILGGFNSLRLPAYAGEYNLAEISGYVGLMAVAGALSLAAGLLRRRRQREPDGAGAGGVDGGAGPVPGAGLWLVVTLVGILLAIGGRTFLGHLLIHVPLYRGQRLQSRNLATVDLGLAVLLALWAERFLAPGARPSRRALRAGLLAPAGAGVAVLVGLAWPGGYGHWLRSSAELFPRGWPYAAASLTVAAAVAVVLVAGPGWRPATRRMAVAAVVVADVGFFAANAAYGWASTSALATGPGAATVALGLGGGRFAVVDPDLRSPAYIRAGPDQVRVPDLNILSGAPSVQGYGSIVEGRYDGVTGTHTQGAMSTSVVSTTLADRLDLTLVLVQPDGADLRLLAALRPPQWSPAGTLGGLLAFRNTHPPSPAWLEPDRPGPAPASGTGTATGTPAGAPTGTGRVVPLPLPTGVRFRGGASFRVHAPAASVLVRSEAWAPGWRARITGPGGRPVADREVGTAGVLQAVPVPAGDWTVRVYYRPPRVWLGLGLGGVGLLGCVGLLLAGRARAGGRGRTG